MLDIPLHQDFETAEPLLARLLHRLSVCPMIVRNTVAGDHQAGPVGAPAAVHEDGAKGWILK